MSTFEKFLCVMMTLMVGACLILASGVVLLVARELLGR